MSQLRGVERVSSELEPDESSEQETEETSTTQLTSSGTIPPVQQGFDQAQGPSASERAFESWKTTAPAPTKKLNVFQKLRLGMKGRKEQVLGSAHEIPNQDIILEQLAHRGAYGGIPSDRLAMWGYRNAGAIADAESGFRAVLFVPDPQAFSDPEHAATLRAVYGGNLPPPVLAFRGTAEKRGMQDDTNRHGVGAYQFSANERKIAGVLAAAGGKAIVTGHSLGGALAQLTACNFPDAIERVVTFQSPGIDKSQADKLAAHNQTAEHKVGSTHHRAQGDLVHMAGEALTDGDVFTFKSAGVGNPMDHTAFPLARLAAARGDLIPGVNDAMVQDGKGALGGDRLTDVEKTSSKDEKKGFMGSIGERARKQFGGLVRDESMEKYVSVWTGVQQMIGTGTFSQKYVLDVIAAAELSDVQRDKMKTQALALLSA